MRERIIRESIESLRREGLRFSVDTLSVRLGISKKTVYKYFDSKEAFATALYETYFSEARRKATELVREGSASARKRLLALYFDAVSMTCEDVFNKYKLNESLAEYTARADGELLEIIFASAKPQESAREREAMRVIINGSFEKLCREKSSPDSVIDRLVNLLW